MTRRDVKLFSAVTIVAHIVSDYPGDQSISFGKLILPVNLVQMESRLDVRMTCSVVIHMYVSMFELYSELHQQ